MNFTTTLEIGAKDCKICPYHWLLPAQVGCDHIHCDVVKQWMPHPLPSNISKAEIRLFNQFQNNVLLTLLNHVRDGKEKQRIRTRVHTIFCQGSRDHDESPLVEECYARAQFELMQLITGGGGSGGEINSENRRNSKSNSPHPHKSAKRRRSSSPVVGSFSPLRNDDEDENDNEDAERHQFGNSSFHHDNEQVSSHHGSHHQTTPTKKQKQQKKKKTTNQEEDSIYDDDDDNNDNENENEKRKRKKNESVIEDQLNHSNSNSSNISALLNTSTDSIQHNHHSHNRRSSSVDPSHHPIVSDVIDLTIHHDFDELLDMTTEDMILPTTTTTTTTTEPTATKSNNNSSKYHLKNFLKHASLSSIREFIIYANDEDILRMNDYLMQYSNDSARPRSDIISIVKHCIDIIRWIVSKNVQFLPYGILSLLTCSGQTIEGKYLQEFFTDTEHGRELLLKKRVELPAMPRIVRKREARDDMVQRGEEEDDGGEEGDDDDASAAAADADASGTSVLLLEPLLRYNNGQFSEEMSKMCRILRKFVLDAHNFKRKQSKVQLRVKREAIEHLSSQHQPTQQHQTQQLYDDSGAGAVPPIDFNQLFNMFNSNSMEMMDPPQPTQPTAATAETTGQ